MDEITKMMSKCYKMADTDKTLDARTKTLLVLAGSALEDCLCGPGLDEQGNPMDLETELLQNVLHALNQD